MELHAGMAVTGNVRLVRPLGQGGMGSVWVADHLALETQVAVKFISSQLLHEQPALLERFKREAKSAAQIKSPHVVQTYDQGVTPAGLPFIVMELMEGESLGERLARAGRMTPEECAGMVSHVAKALTAAHKLGIVHRDIKPDNIFLTQTDDDMFVKVLDFGVAKQTALPSEQAATQTGAMVGTPYFMSPEQLVSAKDVTSAADVWALAVVAYSAITGQMPFRGETLGALIVSITSFRYHPPSRLDPSLQAFDDWFNRAFSNEPSHRFPSAKELADTFSTMVAGSSGRQRGRDTRPSAPVDVTHAATPVGLTYTGDPSALAAQHQWGGGTVSFDNPAYGEAAPGAGQNAKLHASAPFDAQPAPPAATLAGASSSLGVAKKPARSRLRGAAAAALAVAIAGLVGGGIWWSASTDPTHDATASEPRKNKTNTKTNTETNTETNTDSAPSSTVMLDDPPEGMVRVPGGIYTIGCDPQRNRKCWNDEKPAHKVTVKTFAIMTHEATMVAYDECVANNGCPSANKGDGCTWQRSQNLKHPINCVTWLAAEAFCAHHLWRLPTEAEWEIAARGHDAFDHPWGQGVPTCELTLMHDGTKSGCGQGSLSPVGSRPKDKSWVGAFDMAGSVREWTASSYEAYPGGKRDSDRKGKVNRGGSFVMRAQELSASHTRGVDPDNTARPGLGFRCAADL